jgi:hypothetical protein
MKSSCLLRTSRGCLLPRTKNWIVPKKQQKLTAGNQPARSFLASNPAGTHAHRSVQCQDFCVFSLLFSPLVKGGGWSFLYRLVFTYHTLFHLSLHSFTSPQGLSRKYTHFTHHSQNTTQHLVLIYTGTSVSAGLCSSLCLNLFNLFNRQKRKSGTWTVGTPLSRILAESRHVAYAWTPQKTSSLLLRRVYRTIA